MNGFLLPLSIPSQRAVCCADRATDTLAFGKCAKMAKNDKCGKNPELDDPDPAPKNLSIFVKETRHYGELFKPKDTGEDNPPDSDDIAADATEADTDELDLASGDQLDGGSGADEFTATHGIYLADMDRRDRNWSAVKVGKPRLINLSTGQTAVARLVDDSALSLMRRGASGLADESVAQDIAMSLTEPMSLRGPASDHAIDEIVAGLYTEFPNFKEVLQAIRESAQLNLNMGAAWFNIRPILIVGGPGVGKTSLAKRLAAACGLSALYLDGSTIMTSVPFSGGDAVFRTSRAGDLTQHLARSKNANTFCIIDEVDKLTDVSNGGRSQPDQALLGFLEQQSARKVRDQYLNLDIDFSFVNWVLLANDLDKISQPLRDRCKVIVIPPLTPKDLASIATREISRRGLAPELLGPILRACVSGELKSLRKLHKALDAAAAAMTRPRLH